MLAASLGVVAIGAALPFSPWAHDLGFRSLPAWYFAALIGMIAAYLTLVELGKDQFFRHFHPGTVPPPRRERSVHRRAAPFSRNQPLG